MPTRQRSTDETTPQDILEFLQENMVTKEDAKNFLTKDDAKNFLTKDDAKNFATKEDLQDYPTMDFVLEHLMTKEDAKQFATKTELDKVLVKVIDIEEKLDGFATKEDLSTMKSEVITSIDRFAKVHEKFDHELVSLHSKYDRLETRLTTVENRLGPAA